METAVAKFERCSPAVCEWAVPRPGPGIRPAWLADKHGVRNAGLEKNINIRRIDTAMKLVTPYFRSPLAAFSPFADLEREFGRFIAPATDANRAPVVAPPTDVREDKDNIVIAAELPGVRREDIKVALHEGVLSIAAERRSETDTKEGEYHRRERHYGTLERRFEIGVPVNGDAIKATYKDGILTVTVPKTEAAKPRQIGVNVE